MNRKHILVFVIATNLSTALALASANAACSDRPGTPTNVNVFPLPNSQLQVRWTNTAGNDETVWWDVEMTAGSVVVPQPAGIGRGTRATACRFPTCTR
jgi:hypothetical protein